MSAQPSRTQRDANNSSTIDSFVSIEHEISRDGKSGSMFCVDNPFPSLLTSRQLTNNNSSGIFDATERYLWPPLLPHGSEEDEDAQNTILLCGYSYSLWFKLTGTEIPSSCGGSNESSDDVGVLTQFSLLEIADFEPEASRIGGNSDQNSTPKHSSLAIYVGADRKITVSMEYFNVTQADAPNSPIKKGPGTSATDSMKMLVVLDELGTLEFDQWHHLTFRNTFKYGNSNIIGSNVNSNKEVKASKASTLLSTDVPTLALCQSRLEQSFVVTLNGILSLSHAVDLFQHAHLATIDIISANRQAFKQMQMLQTLTNATTAASGAHRTPRSVSNSTMSSEMHNASSVSVTDSEALGDASSHADTEHSTSTSAASSHNVSVSSMGSAAVSSPAEDIVSPNSTAFVGASDPKSSSAARLHTQFRVGIRSKPCVDYYGRSPLSPKNQSRYQMPLRCRCQFSSILLVESLLSDEQVMNLHAFGPDGIISAAGSGAIVCPELALEPMLAHGLERLHVQLSGIDTALESVDNVISKEDKIRRQVSVGGSLSDATFVESLFSTSSSSLARGLDKASILLSTCSTPWDMEHSNASVSASLVCCTRGGGALSNGEIRNLDNDENFSSSASSQSLVARSAGVPLTEQHFDWLLYGLHSCKTLPEVVSVLEHMILLLRESAAVYCMRLSSRACSWLAFSLPVLIATKVNGIISGTDSNTVTCECGLLFQKLGVVLSQLSLIESFVIENDKVYDVWASVVSLCSQQDNVEQWLECDGGFVLLNSRLLELLVLHSELWTSAHGYSSTDSMCISFLRSFRVSVCLPFSRLAEVNKIQLQRARVFEHLVSLLFDVNISPSCVAEIADTLEHMLKYDFYSLEDLTLLVRAFIALTVSVPTASTINRSSSSTSTQALSTVPSLDSQVSPTNGELTSRNRKKSASKRGSDAGIEPNTPATPAGPSVSQKRKSLKKKSFFGGLVSSSSSATSQATLGFIGGLDNFDAVRGNAERCTLIRRCLGSVLMQSASWFSVLQGYFHSGGSMHELGKSANQTDVKTASQSASRVRSTSTTLRNRGLLRMLPTYPRRFRVAFRQKKKKGPSHHLTICYDTADSQEDVSVESSKICFELDQVSRRAIEHELARISGRGISYLLTSFPISQVIFMMYQSIDSVLQVNVEDASAVGLMRYSRRYRDPKSGLLLVQLLAALRCHFPTSSSGSKRMLWLRELELYLPALFVSLVQLDGGSSIDVEGSGAADASKGANLVKMIPPSDVGKRIRAPEHASTTNSLNEESMLSSILNRLDISGIAHQASGLTDDSRADSVVGSGQMPTDTFEVVGGRSNINDIVVGAACAQNLYFPSASRLLSALTDPSGAKMETSPSPLLVSRFLECTMDLLFGSLKSFHRNVVENRYLHQESWNFTSLEPVYGPTALFLGNAVATSRRMTECGDLSESQPPCSDQESRIRNGDTNHPVAIACPGLISSVLEVGRVSADISTQEAMQLFQHKSVNYQATSYSTATSASASSLPVEASVPTNPFARTASLTAKATVTTLLCVFQALYYHSPVFRKQLLQPKIPTSSSSSAHYLSIKRIPSGSNALIQTHSHSRPRLFLDDLLAGVVQIFYSAAKAELVSILLRGSFDEKHTHGGQGHVNSRPNSGEYPQVATSLSSDTNSLRSSASAHSSQHSIHSRRRSSASRLDASSTQQHHPPQDPRTFGQNNEPVLSHLQTNNSPTGDIDFEPTLDEWDSLPSEIIYRSCGSSIGRLCLQLISTVACQRLIGYELRAPSPQASPTECSSMEGSVYPPLSVDDVLSFNTNSAWCASLSMSSSPNGICGLPQSTAVQINYFLNFAVRRRMIKTTCGWIQRQYEAYVALCHEESSNSRNSEAPYVAAVGLTIETPGADKLSSNVKGTQTPPHTPPIATAAPPRTPSSQPHFHKTMSSSNSNNNRSLHCATADVLMCISDVLCQLSVCECGNTEFSVDAVSDKVVAALDSVTQLVRYLRDTVMMHTLPTTTVPSSLSGPSTPGGGGSGGATEGSAAVGTPLEASSPKRGWFSTSKRSAAPSTNSTSALSNMNSSSNSAEGRAQYSSLQQEPAARPKTTGWTSIISSFTGRKQSAIQAPAGRFSDFWREDEVLELCASVTVCILHIRRACVLLLETHRHAHAQIHNFGSAHLSVANKVLTFLLANTDLLFSKDIFPEHLNMYATSNQHSSSLSNLFSSSSSNQPHKPVSSQFTPNAHIHKFFKLDRHKSGYSNHDKYFIGALSCELFSLMFEDDTQTRNLSLSVWGSLLNSSLQVMGRRLFVLDKNKIEITTSPGGTPAEALTINVDLWKYQGNGFSILQSITKDNTPTPTPVASAATTPVVVAPVAQSGEAASVPSEGHVVRNPSPALAQTDISPAITFYAWFGVLPEYIRDALESNLQMHAQTYRERWEDMCTLLKDHVFADSLLKAHIAEEELYDMESNQTSSLLSGLKVGIKYFSGSGGANTTTNPTVSLQPPVGPPALVNPLVRTNSDAAILSNLPVSHRLHNERFLLSEDEFRRMSVWLFSYALKSHAVARRQARGTLLTVKHWLRKEDRQRERVRLFGSKQWDLTLARIGNNARIEHSTAANTEFTMDWNLLLNSKQIDAAPFLPQSEHFEEKDDGNLGLRPRPWFRTDAGRAVILSSQQVIEDNASGVVLPEGLTIAPPELETGMYGCIEPGTDGTVMAIGALNNFTFNSDNASPVMMAGHGVVGEWTLCSYECPSRMKRKLRRGNLVLIRLIDTHSHVDGAVYPHSNLPVMHHGKHANIVTSDNTQQRSNLFSTPTPALTPTIVEEISNSPEGQLNSAGSAATGAEIGSPNTDSSFSLTIPNEEGSVVESPTSSPLRDELRSTMSGHASVKKAASQVEEIQVSESGFDIFHNESPVLTPEGTPLHSRPSSTNPASTPPRESDAFNRSVLSELESNGAVDEDKFVFVNGLQQHQRSTEAGGSGLLIDAMDSSLLSVDDLPLQSIQEETSFDCDRSDVDVSDLQERELDGDAEEVEAALSEGSRESGSRSRSQSEEDDDAEEDNEAVDEHDAGIRQASTDSNDAAKGLFVLDETTAPTEPVSASMLNNSSDGFEIVNKSDSIGVNNPALSRLPSSIEKLPISAIKSQQSSSSMKQSGRRGSARSSFTSSLINDTHRSGSTSSRSLGTISTSRSAISGVGDGPEKVAMQMLAPGDVLLDWVSCEELLGMEGLPRWCLFSDINFYIVEDVAKPATSSSPTISGRFDPATSWTPTTGQQHYDTLFEAVKAYYSLNHGAMDVWLPRNSARQRSLLRNMQLQSRTACTTPSVLIPGGAQGPVAGFVTVKQAHSEMGTVWHNGSLHKWGYGQIVSVSRRCYLQVDRSIEMTFSDNRSCLLTFETFSAREMFLSKLKARLAPTHGVVSSCVPQPQPLLPPALRSSALPFAHYQLRPSDSITERWTKGSMTNFDYLMHLNQRAGRSFSDWTCYPVFPWVLADYHSDTLDLTDPSVFRDLSKPMGALSKLREKAARDRYSTLMDLSPLGLRHVDKKKQQSAGRMLLNVLSVGNRSRTGSGVAGANASLQSSSGAPNDVPLTPEDDGVSKKAYHYGTHYSSSAVVIHYLVRLQPFSSHCVSLQGGRFDRPDRMFRSVRESWLSASGGVSPDPKSLTHNLQDVKELIPEFFFLPDFLSNINGYEMGFAAIRDKQRVQSRTAANRARTTSTDSGAENDSQADDAENGDGNAPDLGVRVGDVELPPWAHGSPKEFIRIHRAALESDYVSAHLHEWIDLIFGYKQTGAAAEKACNTFHFLTYAGAVDTSNSSPSASGPSSATPLSKEARLAYEQQIREFGQTPQQLFSAPHPRRRVRPVNIVVKNEDASRSRASSSATTAASANKLTPSASAAKSEGTVTVVSPSPGLNTVGSSGSDPASAVGVSFCIVGDAVACAVPSPAPCDSTGSADAEPGAASNLPTPLVANIPMTPVTPVPSAVVPNAAAVSFVPVQLQKLELSTLTVTNATPTHVCVVTTSDVCLQTIGIRPLLTNNHAHKLLPHLTTAQQQQLLTNHRSVGGIRLNPQTSAFEGAYNVHCLPVSGLPMALSSAGQGNHDAVLAMGYMESAFKIVTMVEGEWNAVCSFDTPTACARSDSQTSGQQVSVQSNALITAASMSEEDDVLVVCAYPWHTLQIWRRNVTQHAILLTQQQQQLSQLQTHSHAYTRSKASSSVASDHSTSSVSLSSAAYVPERVLCPNSHTDAAIMSTLMTSMQRHKYFPFTHTDTFSLANHHNLSQRQQQAVTDSMFLFTAAKVSTKFGLIVTADSHGGVTLWDLDTLAGMRLLPLPQDNNKEVNDSNDLNRNNCKKRVTCVDIDPINGDVYACIGTWVYVFDINGRLRIAFNINVNAKATATANANANATNSVLNSKQILSINVCPVMEWISSRGCVVGCSDGSVMLWSFSHNRQQLSAASTSSTNSSSRTHTPQDALDNDNNNLSTHAIVSNAHNSPNSVSPEDLAAVCVFCVSESQSAVTCVRVSADMQTLYAGSEEGTVCKWDLACV